MEAQGRVEPLLQRLAGVSGMGPGQRRLVLILPQLGDFDSLEYAQQLVPVLPRLEAAGIALLAIGLGEAAGAQRFCAFTGFPADRLQVESEPRLHRALGLSPGLQAPGGPWPSLLLMCAGIAAAGTLAEVLGRWRTYVPHDRHLTQRGGTFLLETDDTLLYSHRDPGLLGYSATMARTLSFLDPFLEPAASPPTQTLSSAPR